MWVLLYVFSYLLANRPVQGRVTYHKVDLFLYAPVRVQYWFWILILVRNLWVIGKRALRDMESCMAKRAFKSLSLSIEEAIHPELG